MDLLEHQGKTLFEQYGIPVPGRVLYTGDQVALPAGERLVVKAQVPAGKREEHGGIMIVDRADAVAAADRMLGTTVGDAAVDAVLIEQHLDITAERYLAVTIDRAEQSYTCMYAAEGGSGIEARREDVSSVSFYTRDELRDQMEAVADEAVAEVAATLFALMREEDALLAEINPLAVTPDGPAAADAKVRIDDNALYRHEEWRDNRGPEFVALDGNIGVIGNGAGLVMATLDSVHHFGGSPANFLDIGGGADAETMRAAMQTVIDAGVDGLFINVFGGITRCDDVAHGIIDAVEEQGVAVPLVVRLVGTNQDKGVRLLEDNGIHALDSMDACAEKIVEVVE